MTSKDLASKKGNNVTKPTMTYAEAVPHAVRWAMGLEKIEALAGRTYDQAVWGEHGSACNVSGAACVLAGLPEGPPPDDYKAAHPLAAEMMRVPDPRVLPVLAAAVEGGDVEAACAAARDAGLLIHVSGEQTVAGGIGRAYGTATQTVTGGEGVAFDTATQHVTGGEGYAYDNATVRVSGGTCSVRSEKVTVAEHTGGTIVWETYKGGAWTETRRETK